MSMLPELILSGIPTWVWAALIMSAFVVLSAIAIALVRLPLQHPHGARKVPSEDAAAEPSSRP